MLCRRKPFAVMTTHLASIATPRALLANSGSPTAAHASGGRYGFARKEAKRTKLMKLVCAFYDIPYEAPGTGEHCLNTPSC